MTNTTSKRLLSLALEMNRQREQAYVQQGGADVLRNLIAERQLALTPADGWPGSNEEKRKQAKAAAFRDDKALADWEAVLYNAEERLRFIQLRLQLLQTQYQALVDAMHGEYLAMTIAHRTPDFLTLAEDWDALRDEQIPDDRPQEMDHDPDEQDEEEPWEPGDDGIDPPDIVGNIYPTDEGRLVPGSSVEDEIPF